MFTMVTHRLDLCAMHTNITLFLSMHYTTGGIRNKLSKMEYSNRINSIIESIDHLYQHAYSREIMSM